MHRMQLARPFSRSVHSARRHVCTRTAAGPPVSFTTWVSTLHDHWPLYIANVGIGAAVPWVIGGVHGWLKPQRCEDCFGTTTVLCKACGARGRVGGVFSGERPQRCAACDGIGRVQCPRCRGAGMKNSWLWRTDMTMYRTGPQSSHPYRTGRDRGPSTEHDRSREPLL